MSSISTEKFAVKVNQPRLFLGPAELRIGSDSITLVARPIRYGRAIEVFQYLLYMLFGLVCLTIGIANYLHRFYSVYNMFETVRTYYAPIFIPFILGMIIFEIVFGLLFKALRGEPREITLPLTGLTSWKRSGRRFVLKASFASEVRSRRWFLDATNRADAKAIESTLTAVVPLINKNPSRRLALGVLVGFILLGVGIYSIYASQVKKPEVAAIHLEADGSGDYPTLEKAVQKIAEGGTISLGAGTYRLSQSLEINKSINLIGAGMDQTIVTTTTEYYVIRFSGEGSFVLQGLTVQLDGGGKAVVVRVDNGALDFSDCRFKGDGNNGPGLQVIANAIGTVKDCESINNGNTGFSIQGQAQLILENNKCTNNEEGGIAFFDDSQGTARKNICTGNRIGIGVANQAKVDLEENISSDNQESGIIYSDNTSGTARLNECYRNGNSGIWVTDQAQVTLEENTSSTNIKFGIVFAGNTKSVARKNVCSNNVTAGFVVSDQAEPLLEENTCTNNGLGISFQDFAKGTARGNQCSTNETGIRIQDNSQPLLEGNITTENSASGIYYSEKAGGTARQNDCSRNGDAGIAVIGQSQPELEQNTCNDNISGIGYGESAGGSAIQNECSRNKVGIWVRHQAHPVLEGNVCTEGEFGILIENLTTPDLRENDCHDNKYFNIYDER